MLQYSGQKGCSNFPKTWSHLKISFARTVTLSTFRTEDAKILVALYKMSLLGIQDLCTSALQDLSVQRICDSSC